MMKSSALTSFFKVAAVSLIAAGSSLAVAEDSRGLSATQSGEYLQFGMTQHLDIEQLDRAFTERIAEAVERQSVRLTARAQSMAEARYRQDHSVDMLVAYPAGDAYQSVAIAR